MLRNEHFLLIINEKRAYNLRIGIWNYIIYRKNNNQPRIGLIIGLK